MQPAVSPPARTHHNLVWHDRLGSLVMFGGCADGGGWLDDLWIYETALSRWTGVKTTAVPPPCASATCYDVSQNLLVLFNQKGQTWVCKIQRAGETSEEGAGRRSPIERVGTGPGETDPDRRRTAGSRGGDATSGVQEPAVSAGPLSAASPAKLLERSDIPAGKDQPVTPPAVAPVAPPAAGSFRATWTELKITGSSPPPRRGATTAMLFDPKRKRCVLFGGSGYPLRNDLWTLDVAKAGWDCLDKGGSEGVGRSKPVGIQHHNFLYDEERDLYWLVHPGGGDELPPCFWAYNPAAGTWESTAKPAGVPTLSAGPVPALRGSLAYAPALKRFAGVRGVSFVLFTPGSDQLASIVRPRGERPNADGFHDGGLAYDRVAGLFVLFGGSLPEKQLNDTWVFDPAKKAWSQPNALPRPPPRDFHRLLWHDKLGAMVLFGGRQDPSTWLNDLWVYETSADRWTEIRTTKAPPAMASGGTNILIYDSANDALVCFACDGSTWVCRIERVGTGPGETL
jgi:hypothetical protein